ncbi:hypothetical protein CONCODRAFT_13088 [Conidiobolus coronatus NRRL 28638]|uniref:Uncharacterized protein n=1 Tax=Conidiobolus coronatus (strain ATCC 28846 / CBS 209.66 / NRRL 28638) TaxID=796925 RepID=A0A137NRK6_CONC2|nr:hypothetical protein CONCODRAFT_13088 [Conidiobolus coronatus NRRL 28638]|eukprot:KXN65354.1 hypothetical protein CONCODRAFT_13088 [Conidiobolus coronatus NRRL 28638]
MKFTLVSLFFVAFQVAQPTGNNALDQAASSCKPASQVCYSNSECCDRKCVPTGHIFRCMRA